MGGNSGRVALVTYSDPDVGQEASALAEAAGYRVETVVTLKRLPHGRYGIGEGKANLLKELREQGRFDSIVVDDKINAAENYNLSKHCGCNVIDREKLVLEIFLKRANSIEAKLQVRMAELMYELPRTRETVSAQTAGEQPGMFGYGSYEVERHYRSIKNMIDFTRKKLKKIEKRRELFRASRSRADFPMVSLAGYTSAGKTTLFNRLTDSDQPVAPSVFTTLSTTTRRAEMDGVSVLLSDTVGFISRLPHYMIDAFKATLEELSYADVVLLVVDVSGSPELLTSKYDACMGSLAQLGVPADKILPVLNKADRVERDEAVRRASLLGIAAPVIVSAKQGTGVQELTGTVRDRILGKAQKRVTEVVPQGPAGHPSA
ncbi:MAG: GTPase HflX [Nitrososphaerota archaeon]|nr:GTPase HflX [Nitrososphaerota archaeon]MDG6940177.1 GTPase HflX [Nitrososphaerota archaeon]